MLRIRSSQVTASLIGRSRQALRVTQNDLALLLGVARRTMGRWEARKSAPTEHQRHKLARTVHPRDPGLAEEIAIEAGTTLEGLGLVEPAPPLPPAPLPAASAAIAGPPPRAFPPIDLVLDAIVHVAAQTLEEQDINRVPIGAVTAVLRSAFSRARLLGLTVEEVDGALAARARTADPAAAAAAKAGRARAAR
jgi:DNA-binding XRE family transcriptional regulator